VASYNYLNSRKITTKKNVVNVVDLMDRAKSEKKKENKKTIIVAATAVSALALSGIIISL
tara:strand:+ start:224 stop:403 length:180 start_codon:yes stop_codon:yes gene_type:complete